MWRLVLWKGRDRLRREWQLTAARWREAPGTRPHDWEKTVAAALDGHTWGDHFTQRDRCWLWTDAELDDIAAWMRAQRPEICRATLWRAQRAVTRHVDILGYGEVELPDHYDWVTDPISGARWPRGRAECIPIILNDPRSDIKHLWEIARFAFAPTLGAAWRTTGDRSCAKSLMAWIDDFISANPYGYGPHWTNPMEAAIRAVNWMVGWSLGRPVLGNDEDFVRRFVGSLIDHGRFIAANLERTRRGINTNHYIADCVGLYAIAAFLPEWPEATHWHKLAVAELAAEAEVQILPDGFCYESSIGYHRLTFEMWFLAWRLADRLAEPGLRPLSSRLLKMAEFSLWHADDTGRLPAFGDGDDGRFVFWQPRDPHDHASVWDLAEAAWGLIEAPHPRHAQVEPTEDVLWLLGSDAYQRLIRRRTSAKDPDEEPIDRGSCLFPNARIAVMRSRRWLIHAYANPVGTGGVGGHKHNDLLSFTAACDGAPIVVDPGTWAYTTDPALRNRLRRTAAHATVCIDGEEQNRFLPRQLFALREDATPEIAAFEQNGTGVRIVMRHDGYRRLASPVAVEREIALDHVTETVSITDRLSGVGEHDIEVILPLGDRPAHLTEERTILLGDRDAPSLAVTFGGEGNWTTRLIPSWRSEAYGRRRTHHRLAFTARLTLPAAWTVTLTPVAVRESTEEAVPAHVAGSRPHHAAETSAVRAAAGTPEVAHAGS